MRITSSTFRRLRPTALLGLPAALAAFWLSLIPPARADLILHLPMEEAGPELTDVVGGLVAFQDGFGHLHQVEGPAGFGSAVALEDNGSWRWSEADSAALRDLANDFTVAAWVRLNSDTVLLKLGANPELHRIIGDDEEWDGDGWSFGVWTDGRVRFTKNGIVDIDLGAPGAVATDTWTHVAATVSSTAGVTLFVDGVAVGTNASTAAVITGPGGDGLANLYGVGRSYGPAQAQWVAGAFDEVRVYDHVLTQAEILALTLPLRDPSIIAPGNLEVTSNGLPTNIAVTLSNDGDTQDLTVSDVIFTGAAAGAFAVESLPGPIPPGESGELALVFTPSGGGGGGAGFFTATALIASNDPLVPSFEIDLTVLVIDPGLEIDSSIEFGVLPSGTPPQEIEVPIGNSGGTAVLTISDVSLSGDSADRFAVVDFPDSLAPGAAGAVTLRFDPSGAEGTFTALLEIASNSAGLPLIEIPVAAVVEIGDIASHLLTHFTFDDPGSPGDDSGILDNDGMPWGEAAATTDAKVGSHALLLDGDGDYILVGNGQNYTAVDDDGDGFTAAAWVKVAAAAPDGVTRIFSTFMDPVFNANGWGFGFANSNQLIATTYGLYDYVSPVGTAPTFDEWHHIACVYEGVPISTVAFYVDGALVGRTTAPVTGMNDTTVDFIIGGLALPTALQWFHGIIDDLRVYDVELTEAQIGEIMEPPPTEAFRIVDIEYDAVANSATVTWTSKPGRFYIVYRSFDLENYADLDDSVPSGGDTTTFEDTALPEGTPNAYYRIEEFTAP